MAYKQLYSASCDSLVELLSSSSSQVLIKRLFNSSQQMNKNRVKTFPNQSLDNGLDTTLWHSTIPVWAAIKFGL